MRDRRRIGQDHDVHVAKYLPNPASIPAWVSLADVVPIWVMIDRLMVFVTALQECFVMRDACVDYSSQTKILDGRVNISECIFETHTL